MGQICCKCCRNKATESEIRQHELDNRSTVSVSTFEVLELVEALYPYTALGDNELSFNTGNTMEVINKDDEDWWLARHPGQTQLGYIPAPYVAPTASLESMEWYHGDMTRLQVKQLLMSDMNTSGAFLVRKSPRTNGYVLSVKTLAPGRDTPEIVHYNINQVDGWFKFGKNSFISLIDLVEHFMHNGDIGLPTSIRKYPCVRIAPNRQDISMETKDSWEISRNEITFVRKIGSGSFGEVWLGKWKNSFDVAVKTMKDGKMNVVDFLAEAKVMKSLRHPNIIALYGVCSSGEPLLITEFMSQGALLDLLRSEYLELEIHLYIATQAAAAMEYLEKKQLIHRDLAARNVLVAECYRCKVADFGLSKLCEEANYDTKESKGRLPVKWTAPEALSYRKYSSKSDVWSFGVMMMEIITHGSIPYPHYTNHELLNVIINGYRMPQPPSCPDILYDLIMKCWDSEPMRRPTFYYIHDFLENYSVQSEASYYKSTCID